MNGAPESLDKSFFTPLDPDLGTITIRLVVLPRAKLEVIPDQEAWTLPVGPDDGAEDVDSAGDSGAIRRPVESFLESSKRGKWVAVFLVNGQRQHALDNTFISRDLDLKYLRHRMFVVVDVDGMSEQAKASLMHGSRQSFYQGETYHALYQRLIATLKDDPDLARLEEAAEEEISSLRGGDAAVKAALDDLIHEHGQHGRSREGTDRPGSRNRQPDPRGALMERHQVVVEGRDIGEATDGPTLRMSPDVTVIRLHPDEEQELLFFTRPTEPGAVERLTLDFDIPLPELQVRQTPVSDGVAVHLIYAEPKDDTEPNYPLRTTLRAVATLKGESDPRVVTCKVMIAPRARRPRRPPTPVALHDPPTYLRLITRQPITMTVQGPDAHIKLRWDGRDELIANSAWRLAVYEGGSQTPVSGAAFTMPFEGRFELVLPVPPEAEVGTGMSWRVDAIGSDGTTLSASFGTLVIEPLNPRRVTAEIRGGADSPNDYDIKYLKREDWGSCPCFEAQVWTGNDPGSFEIATGDRGLRLLINEDFQPFLDFKEDLTRRRLAEATISQRTLRYTTHLAFHLWQMSQALKARQLERQKAATEDEAPAQISGDELSAEIRRVATTLLQVMERAS